MARFKFGKKKKNDDSSSIISEKTTITSNSPDKMTRHERKSSIEGGEYTDFGGNFSQVTAQPTTKVAPVALHVSQQSYGNSGQTHVPDNFLQSGSGPDFSQPGHYSQAGPFSQVGSSITLAPPTFTPQGLAALLQAPSAHRAASPWKRFKIFDSPFPRYRHAASAISSEKSEIFLMGGLKEGSVFGDTWKISPVEDHGKFHGYAAKSVDVANLNNPPARVGHSAVLCGNAFIIFGGDTVDTDLHGFPDNNFYLFNINNNKYTIPNHILNKPNGRYGHTVGVISLSSVSSRLYLFGGQLENDVFNDLYYFELNTFKSPKAKWELVEPLNNFKPPPLTNHSISVYKHKMYVFGGVYNNERVSNDLWSYDAMVNKWWQIPVTGTIPAPVNEHSSCIVGDKLYIYGGNDFSGVIYNTLYVLDLHTFVWSKLGDDIVGGPGPRCGHSMTYLPKYNKIIIMGGDKNDYVVTDVNDFETYEEFSGEEVGTMIFELDVQTLDSFLPKEPKKAVSAVPVASATASLNTASANSFAKVEDPYRQGERHARSSSAGLDDFRTPSGSPDRFVRVRPEKRESRESRENKEVSAIPESTDARVSSGGYGSESYGNTAGAAGTAAAGAGLAAAAVAYGLNESKTKALPEPNNFRATSPSPVENLILATSPKVEKSHRSLSPEKPVLEKAEKLASSDSNGYGMKKLIAELTTELTSLKTTTKTQMQNATERINLLEATNSNLNNRLLEKDHILTELKASIDPKSLEIDESDSITSSKKRLSITELSKYKLDRLELNNKLLYLEQENSSLNEKFTLFEPFMNNQVGELSKFQKIIKSQEEKIQRLTSQAKDELVLHREINDWKSKHDNLQIEFDNFKQLHAQDDFTDDEEEVSSGVTADDVGNRSLNSTATGRRTKKDISTQLESLVNIWNSQSTRDKKPVQNDALASKLQKQLDELLIVGKQNDQKSNGEITKLKEELNEKVQNLKQFEENYRDALQSVNNTSKALKMNDDESRNQKQMIEKLIKENNELQLFMKASKRHSSRGGTGGPIAPGIGSPNLPHAITEEDETVDDDSALNNAHFNMKIQDLEADLYILKQERDQLKESVTGLQKELYLLQRS